ncbi:hypothetical protein CC1G_02478 [Coprinopsis cinerea okayama7|uniref:Uncharacterized protein n=1 Tax=Coprinopsis cinerea (strain Okayama-7 / 130 / ATCC MYA-4618 / FGSC 9003) TaxID=240176 RepID=A8NBL8_COPC7|nr:hypothetical protein CC1G_02478 [Coprinopsis cinerea okayama7\|eukprot:XP_001832216.2 hypothetical protein CC1G_02478 [Coprinopsis cinerea okayama7\
MSDCIDRRAINFVQGRLLPRPGGLTFDVYKVQSTISGEFVPSMKAFIKCRNLTIPPENSYVTSAELLIPAPVFDISQKTMMPNKRPGMGKRARDDDDVGSQYPKRKMTDI